MTIDIIDISTYRVNDEGTPDLDPSFTPIRGRTVKAENVARRLETDAGALEDDPSFGFNLTRRLAQRTSDRTLAEIQQGVEQQCAEEESLVPSGCKCVATQDATTKAIRAAVHLTDNEGPWEMVVEIGDVTTAILRGPG